MGFSFNKTAQNAIRRYLESVNKKWSWAEYQAVAKGAGYELLKTSKDKNRKGKGQTQGSKQVYRLSFASIGLDVAQIPPWIVTGYGQLHPHIPHPPSKPAASIAVATLMDVIVLLNLAFPEEEKLNELLDERILSSRALERLGK